MLGPWGRRVLSAAQLEPGRRVLDVGCGCGATTVEAARQVGRSGRVLGIDVDPAVLEVARQRAVAADLRQVVLVAGDAQDFAFEAAGFDAVISRFGTLHFADPAVAFANLRRATVAGGGLSIVCWRGPAYNAWARLPLEAVSAVVTLPPRGEGGGGPFTLADGEALKRLVEEAGWRDVSLAAADEPAWVGDDVDDAIDFFEQTDGRPVLAMLDEGGKARLRDALRQRMAPFLGDEGVYLPASAWLLTATNRGG
jgi:SAM-dependent methyltransferase